MKKQNNIKPFRLCFFFGWMFIILFQFTTGQAQSELNADGTLQTISHTSNQAVEYKVPDGTPSGYLYIRAEGADGGARSYNFSGKKAAGGEGATVWGVFPIGSATNQIAPGSTLRFIVGEKGESRWNLGTLAAGSGGGGTGVFYKKKGANNWQLLLVAGAGSGAYLDGNLGGLATVRNGNPGQITEYGQRGGGDGGSGGFNGERGHKLSSSYTGGGGGGIYVTQDDMDWILHVQGKSVWRTKLAGLDDSVTPAALDWEGAGGDDGTQASYVNGGWGCGGGGAGDEGGGGGGGYSGGGGGDVFYPGGGGGSYLSSMAVQSGKIQNGTTHSPEDGFVEIQFSPIIINHGTQGLFITPAANVGMAINKDGAPFDIANHTNLYLVNRASNDAYLGSKLWKYNIFSRQIILAYDAQGRKCIDLENRSTSNGNRVQLYDCKDNEVAQQWLLDGGMIKYAADPSKCLIMQNNNTDWGNPLVIYSCNSISDQQKKWTIHSVESPIYITRKTTAGTGTESVLTKDGDIDNVSNGRKLIAVNKVTNAYYTPNKVWAYHPADNTFRFVRHEDKCIDLSGNNTNNGTRIQLWDCVDTDAQKWMMWDNLIKNKAHPSKCLVVNEGLTSSADNGEMVIWDCDDSRLADSQKLWTYQLKE